MTSALLPTHAQRVRDAHAAVDGDDAEVQDGGGGEEYVTSGPRHARVEAQFPAAGHLRSQQRDKVFDNRGVERTF